MPYPWEPPVWLEELHLNVWAELSIICSQREGVEIRGMADVYW